MSRQGSSDDAVQHTNDDSVLSKRSAVHQGYFDDPFLRAFVPKLARRSPLINRGYFLRMAAMTQSVHRLLGAPPFAGAPGWQCVSLGAGFDTLGIRTLIAGSKPGSVNTDACRTWFDADFPAVIETKRRMLGSMIRGAANEANVGRPVTAPLPPGFESLVLDPVAKSPASAFAGLDGVDADGAEVNFDFDLGRPAKSSASPVNLRGVGLDLRRPTESICELASRGFDPAIPTLIYAECVLQYLTAEDSTEFLRALVAACESDVVLLTYDQVRPGDAFGKRMSASLRSRGSPLLGCETGLVSAAELSARFATIGLADVASEDFFPVAAQHFDAAEHDRMRGVEPFDEFEEWAQMCGHYGLTVGQKRGTTSDVAPAATLGWRRSAASSTADSTPGEIDGNDNRFHARPWPTGRKPVAGWGHGAASCSFDGLTGAVVVTFGGFTKPPSAAGKSQARTNTLHAVCLNQEAGTSTAIDVIVDTGTDGTKGPSARMFHGFAALCCTGRTASFVAWGGRDGPAKPFADAWVLELTHRRSAATGGDGALHAKWIPVVQSGATPSPRYRHAFAAGATASREARAFTLLVAGGRNKSGRCVDDASVGTLALASDEGEPARLVWTAVQGWAGQAVPCCSAVAAFVPGSVGEPTARVLVCGGVDDVSEAHGDVAEVDVQTSSVVRFHAGVLTPRFGASALAVAHPEEPLLVLVGGAGQELGVGATVDSIASPAPGAVVCKARNERIIADSDDPVVRAACVPLHTSKTRRSGGQQFACVGGGFTCFSFGSHFAEPRILELRATKTGSGACQSVGGPSSPHSDPTTTTHESSQAPFQPVRSVPWVGDASWSARGREPVAFRGVPLGTCVGKWTPAHLASQSVDVPITVHASSSPHLEFVDKNYKVFGVSFADLVDHCFSDASEETWYFRSVGRRPKTRGDAEARELFAMSFPTLAPDFSLAEGSVMASEVNDSLHQSVLRVNQRGMRLWPHYDTLDNVLCQIVGRKRVLLFPPPSIPHLYMHGSTSKVANLDAPDLSRYPLCLAARAAAFEVTLDPGDVLFIPNMWVHQVVAVDACVSINCFFERLPRGKYDPTDSYGNRDIPEQAAARDAALAAVRRELGAISDPEFRDLALQQLIATLSTKGIANTNA